MNEEKVFIICAAAVLISIVFGVTAYQVTALKYPPTTKQGEFLQK